MMQASGVPGTDRGYELRCNRPGPDNYASDSLVRTASITQVRQPIHARSVARWKAYLPWIPELGEIDSDRS